MARPIHPGEILKEELEVRGLSANQLAIELRVPANRITDILNEKRAVSADTALRLARHLGTSPEVWLRLQAKYDLKVTAAATSDEIGKIARAASAPDAGASRET